MSDLGKYVKLGDSYDKDWSFIQDDAELEVYRTDGSLDEGDFVVEVKAIYKVRRKETITYDLQELDINEILKKRINGKLVEK